MSGHDRLSDGVTTWRRRVRYGERVGACSRVRIVLGWREGFRRLALESVCLRLGRLGLMQ